MANQRLQHEAAWATARSIMGCIENVFREEEKRDALMEIYERVKAGLEAYETQVQRQQLRLRPGRN